MTLEEVEDRAENVERKEAWEGDAVRTVVGVALSGCCSRCSGARSVRIGLGLSSIGCIFVANSETR